MITLSIFMNKIHNHFNVTLCLHGRAMMYRFFQTMTTLIFMTCMQELKNLDLVTHSNEDAELNHRDVDYDV